MGLIFGARSGSAAALIAWMIALFLGILIHELGHALVMRYFGYYPSIVLYGMGGLAIPGSAAFGARPSTTFSRIAISAAGPAAGFLVAAILGVVLHLTGHGVFLVPVKPILLFLVVDQVGTQGLTVFVNYFFFICVLWGIINLLPVLPLDGGQISHEVFTKLDPWDGSRKALILSAITAVAVAAYGLLVLRDLWIALLFGYFAFNSFAMLSAGRRDPW
jgi:Zn-dependent protease